MVEAARKSPALSHHQAQVGDNTEVQQYQCSPLPPLVNNVHIHSRQAAHTRSAEKGSSVLLLPRFLFMIN